MLLVGVAAAFWLLPPALVPHLHETVVEQGRILEANAPACRLLGYSLEEIREVTISDLHPYEVPRFLEFASQVARNGKWQSHELSCRAKWGELIPAELSATAVQYDGRPSCSSSFTTCANTGWPSWGSR